MSSKKKSGSNAAAAEAYRKSLMERTKSINLKSHAEPVLEYVDKMAEKIEFFKELEKKTGIEKKFILIGVIVMSVLVLFLNFLSSFISSLVGLGFPAYASFRAIESRRFEDDTQWLTYWVIFAIFSFLENFITIVLHYVPFYYKAKVIILLALQTPGSPLSSGKLYKEYLKPLVLNQSKPTGDDSKSSGTQQVDSSKSN